MWQVVSDWAIWHAPQDNAKYKSEIKNVIKTLKNKLKTARQNKEEYNKQIDRIEKRIIEGRLDESRGNRMEFEINDDIKKIKKNEQKWLTEINNKENELKELENDLFCVRDLTMMNDEERYELIKKTIKTVYIWKTGKRGTYNLDFHFYGGVIKSFVMCSQNKNFKYWDEYGEPYNVNIMFRLPRRTNKKS